MARYIGVSLSKPGATPSLPETADLRQARADAILAAATLADGRPMHRSMVDRFAEYILTGKWSE